MHVVKDELDHFNVKNKLQNYTDFYFKKVRFGLGSGIDLGQKQWWAKLLRLLTVNSLSYFVKIKY